MLLALLAPLLGLVLRPWTGLVAALAAGLLYVVAAQLLFDAGWIVPVVAPLAGLALGFVGTLLVHWLGATFERARTRDVFARFVPDAVVDQVLARATEEGDPRLGGERMDATVLFSDLRGFTTFAEAREPEQVIEVLNRYLTAMSDAILDHGGTLVAYMGDGIMAVFGAPVAADDHADRALAAAREMLARLERFNAWIRERGLRRRVQDGHRAALGAGHVGQRRLGAAARVRGDRRHDEHRRAAGGHDEGHAVPAVRRRADARPAAQPRPTSSSSCPSSRCAGASTGSASGACARTRRTLRAPSSPADRTFGRRAGPYTRRPMRFVSAAHPRARRLLLAAAPASSAESPRAARAGSA